MAKKKSSAARLRKNPSSPSTDHENGVVADERGPSDDVGAVAALEERPAAVGPRSKPSPPGAKELAADESNLRATSPRSHPSQRAEDDDEGAADGAVAVEDAAQMEGLPPPLAMRSHLLDSAASCSSISGSTIPRSRSLVLNDNSTVLQAMPTSKAEVVEVMAEQSWLITKLTVQLLWALRNSFKWVLMALRLVTFVAFLLPALLRMVWYWAFDAHVHKNLIYGLKGRNLLDVYTVPSDKIRKPTSQQLHQSRKPRSTSVHSTSDPSANDAHEVAQPKRPVVVFLSGGAWIIGYKGWGALMGKALAAFGIVVVMPDYRNFPQGILPQMVEDTTMALQWVFDNVHHFGGDPENVTLVGQSAGAHIAMCTLLEQVEKRKLRLDSTAVSVTSPSSFSSCSGFSVHSVASDAGAMLHQAPTWELRQIRNFIGISGPYNIEVSMETFHRHGFDRSVVDRIMDHRISYFSPALRLFDYSEHAHAQELLHDFPPTYLYHGTADHTVTWKSSGQLAEAMKSCGLHAETQYLKDKTHTDIIIEDPISGNDDLLLAGVIEVLKKRAPRDARGQAVFQFVDAAPLAGQSYPHALVKAARYVNPF